MIVKVAADFRGELILAPIGYPVTSNDIVHLKEDQFSSTDVQLAIQRGWLTVEGEFILKKKSTLGKVKAKNITGRPLSVGDVSFNADEMKFLTDDQVSEAVVQDAIRMNMIKIEALELDSLVKEKKAKAVKPEVPVPEILRAEDPETTIRTWDASAEELMDKEETKKKHFKEIDPVHTPSDLLDTEEAVEEIEKKTTKKKSGRKKSAKKSIAKSASKKKTITPVGTQKPEPKADDIDALLDEIAFVDKKQEAERILNHPKLKDKIGELIDLDDNE
tara:strand:+ start:93 stop:917 length:825 start_codon:yes stop_codon:yes gene_type:complete